MTITTIKKNDGHIEAFKKEYPNTSIATTGNFKTITIIGKKHPGNFK